MDSNAFGLSARYLACPCRDTVLTRCIVSVVVMRLVSVFADQNELFVDVVPYFQVLHFLWKKERQTRVAKENVATHPTSVHSQRLVVR